MEEGNQYGHYERQRRKPGQMGQEKYRYNGSHGDNECTRGLWRSPRRAGSVPTHSTGAPA